MKRRLIWAIVALLVNLALLPLALATPSAAAAKSRNFFFHCCQETPLGKGYCCYSCCILTWDCMDHEGCGRY